MVENTQDEDWNNVRMALVSGRPISFQMNLYDPLFVPRPMVEPELFASLRPPTYSGAMDGRTMAGPADGALALDAGDDRKRGQEGQRRSWRPTAGRSRPWACRSATSAELEGAKKTE